MTRNLEAKKQFDEFGTAATFERDFEGKQNIFFKAAMVSTLR